MDFRFYKDALFSGMTNNAFKFGTTLTLGWFWMRTAGCSALYRGPKISEVDFDNTLSVELFGSVQINVPNYLQHAANQTYFYVLRKVNGCGRQEKTFSASAVVEIDSDGNLAKAKPNKVFGINAKLVTGPRAKLIWYYCPLHQQSKPAYFEVYGNIVTEQIDYENPLATIDYLGRRYYCWLSDVLSEGQYSFAVRVFNSSGINENSSAVINIDVTNSLPDSADILSVETI